MAAALWVAACNSGPSQSPENSVGGPNVVSFAKAALTKDASSLALDWGSKAQAGQIAIADVLTYGGKGTVITPPTGWTLIRDDSTATTRQTLYWHAVSAKDPSTATWTFNAPVDTQGAILLIDNITTDAPVDVSSGNTGNGGTVTAKSIATTGDGDLILSFNATDFGGSPHSACDKCDGLNPTLPNDVSVLINQETTRQEYWILANYQSQMGETEAQDSQAPQIFNWVAAQLAIKRGAATSPTP